MSWLRRTAFDRGAVLALLALTTYLWLAPSHIVAADNAEFCALSVLGGRAHPSGYPLYVLYLRAMSWLPATPAHAASLATALLAGIQVMVLHAACRAWGARTAAASFATTIFAASPIVLRVHTEADVFALNSLLASAILLLSAPSAPLRGVSRAAALGLFAGFALANNLTCALLAPIGFHGLVLGAREQRRAHALGAAVVCFLVGLTPYVYLFVAPDAASWAPVHSIDDLIATILRADYGTTSHLPGGPTIPMSMSLVSHLMLIGRIWLWLPLLGGLAALGRRAWSGADRVAFRLLAATWLLTGPIFAWRLGAESDGVGAYITARMQILSAVVLAIPVAVFFDGLAERAPRTLSPVRATAFAALAFGLLVAVSLPRLARVHGRAVEDGVANLLISLPPDAVAFVVSEDQCFGARYLTLARRQRVDATVVCTPLLTRDWYRARLPIALPPSSRAIATAAQAKAVLAAGRPLLVDGAQTDILKAFPNYPVGVLRRVVLPGTDLPNLGHIVEAQQALFSKFALDARHPHRDDDFAAVAFKRYVGVWRDLALALDAAGNHDQAAAAMELARQLQPD